MQQGSVTITTAAQGAPEGHDAAMLARYEAGQAAAAAGISQVPPADASAPAATTAAAPAVAPAAAPAATPAATADAPAASFVDTVVTNAGLTREALTQEYLAGGLKPESYAALAKQGITKADVDGYLAGLKAQADGNASAYESAVITATVGSKEKYTEVVNWAAEALSDAEVEAFNAAVSSGNQAQAQLAVAGLQARFAAANPAEPPLLNQGVPNGGVTGYESWAQVSADMKKPEYKTDPAFRDKVKQRLAASPADMR